MSSICPYSVIDSLEYDIEKKEELLEVYTSFYKTLKETLLSRYKVYTDNLLYQILEEIEVTDEALSKI